MPSFSSNSEFQGLGTFTVKVPEASQYTVKGTITLPTVNTTGSEQSQLLVVINVNGSPVYTGQVSARGFEARTACAANDVITVVFSSPLAIDAANNAIKSTISISQGLP